MATRSRPRLTISGLRTVRLAVARLTNPNRAPAVGGIGTWGGGRVANKGGFLGSPASVTVGAGNASFTFLGHRVGNLIGAQQNSIRIRVVVAGANTALSVSVSGTDITVNSATNGSSVATSTAAQIVTALNANAAAAALGRAYLQSGSDGSGVTGAIAFTNLTGGGTGAA